MQERKKSDLKSRIRIKFAFPKMKKMMKKKNY